MVQQVVGVNQTLRVSGVQQAPMSGYASLTRPTLVGKPDVAQRLCESLQVDIEKMRQLLGWSPPLTLDQGLKKAAEGYGRETGV